jgi:hypothetical protein
MRTTALASAIFLALASFSAEARDLQVRSAVALDGKIECPVHTNYWITIATGPCELYTPPAKVALGEHFAANGKEHQIGVTLASQAEKDMLTNGLDIRKGEWTCVAAASLDNIPSDQNQDKNITWLSIRKCEPNETLPTTMDR